MLDSLRQDLRYGFRVLWRRPDFTVIAFLILALGIGATTALFSVVNGVLLRPLPYRDSGRIVTLWQNNSMHGVDREGVSPPNFLDYQSRNHVFEAMAVLRPYGLDYTEQGEPETFQAWLVSEGFFEILGVSALHGRTFVPEEYRVGNENVVLLGNGLWKRRFGSDPNIVGQKMVLDGKPYVVVGILPAEFHFTDKREVIAPYIMSDSERRRRSATYLNVIARLKPGVSVEQARAEMNAIAAQLSQEYPQANREMGAAVVPLYEQMVGQVRPTLLVLLAAVGFLLLIACANVANLQLARGAYRGREFAIRAAMGAGRARLVRQLLIENLLLALLGGAGGLLLARWGINLILALSPGNVLRFDQIRLDGGGVAFALGVSLLTALIFGVVPVLRLSKPDMQESLKEGAQSTTPGVARHRLRRVLVVAEIAMAMVLLVGAGLLVRSFVRLLQVNPGFVESNALLLQVHVQDLYPKPEQQAAYFEQTIERLTALPGVKVAGAVSAPPFVGEGSIDVEGPFTIEGRPAPPAGQEPTASQTIATSDYFRALGIPLQRGRLFARTDNRQAPPVALVNETMARRYWPDEDPLGKRIALRLFNEPVTAEIVGVVGDVRHSGLDSSPRPEVFFHHPQAPFGSMTFVVRTEPDPLTMLPAIKKEIWAVNKNQPFYSIRTVEQLVSDSLGERRFSLFLLGIFAALAFALAGAGIYGLVSFSASQRTHELGVRMALGAPTVAIMRVIVGEGLILAFIGVGMGLAGALALTRALSSMLFGVTPTDPLTFASISTLLIVVALLASYIPARRATKISPSLVLRHE